MTTELKFEGLKMNELRQQIESFLAEDTHPFNETYFRSLPIDPVTCRLNFKSDLMVAGLPFFFEVFRVLGVQLPESANLQKEWEGKKILGSEKKSLSFILPFAVALTGERVALNILQRTCAVATHTHKFVEKAQKYGIAILDTRKTTPGLRSLEKYAVRVGGGSLHRSSQTDVWMIKDNHKNFFGGLAPAVAYFQKLHSFYTPMVVEIHSVSELQEAIALQIRHVMLDNFSTEDLQQALKLKPATMTYEISGGIRIDTVEKFCLPGVDALSVGGLTHNPPPVDLSLKFGQK